MRIFRKPLEKLSNFDAIIFKCQKCDDTWSDADLLHLAAEVYGLNVLNQYVNRTLRKDVAEHFADRNIITCEYSYTESENRLYDAIVKACQQRYATDRRSAFSIITPERRAASCLMAMKQAVKNWQSEVKDYFDANDGDPDSEEGVNASDVKSAWISASKAVDMCPVPECDSKLEKLLEFLKSIFNSGQELKDQKVMVFCIFKATIQYLKTELKKRYPEALVETIDGDTPLTARQNATDITTRDSIRLKFMSNDKPCVLICSEVAGEGLDFQFCHYLVNYDMPWNPAKLEQRAGRIDRMGQDAERVTIVNLVNKRTIEDHIMALLFERVKLFGNALGPLGEVLSKCQKNFTASLLSPERSQQAKEEYEKRIVANVENKFREQQDFELAQAELFGAVNYFYDKSNKARSNFHEAEIELLWNQFLGETANRVSKSGDLYELPIDRDTVNIVLSTLGQGGRARLNCRKESHYKSLLSNLMALNKPLQYTFNQEFALKRLDVQFLNVGHPFIQGALENIKIRYQQNNAILMCAAKSDTFPLGSYLFFKYRFSIFKTGSTRVGSVEDHLLAYNLATHNLSACDQEIIPIILRQGKGISVQKGITESIELSKLERQSYVRAKAEEILSNYEQLTAISQNSQKAAILRQLEIVIAKKKYDLQFRHDPSDRERIETEIIIEKQSVEKKLCSLENACFRLSVKCTGIIYFENGDKP